MIDYTISLLAVALWDSEVSATALGLVDEEAEAPSIKSKLIFVQFMKADSLLYVLHHAWPSL